MSNQHKAWSEEEKIFLRKLLDSADVVTTKIKKGEMAKILQFFPNRSRSGVYNEIFRQRSSGASIPKYRPWTDEEIAKLRSLYSGTNWRLNLSEHFSDRHIAVVREKAKELGLSRPRLITEAKQLTSEQCALMAGLLLGDGCLSHRIGGQGQKQHINTIAFSNTDVAQVELFASMASNCRVRRYDANKHGGFKPKFPFHYECSISSREAVKHTLLQILPYLVGAKLKVAREMLFCLEGGHEKKEEVA